MANPDGRVEAGQSLKRAISARRWNDLCDAADIVHGRRPQKQAEASKNLLCIKIPMSISSTQDFSIGTVVEYDATLGVFGFSQIRGGEFAQAECPKAKVYEARLGDDITYPYSASFGVTLAGGKNSDVVPVILAGYAVCRVNVISTTSPVFAKAAIVRTAAQQTAEELRGCLETTNCGCGAIAKVLFLEGGEGVQWAGVVL